MENGWIQRVAELEAEVAKLTAERDKLEAENKKYHEWVSAINKYEAWKDENRRLQIENRRLQLMNPCNHTGFESAPCDVCGYPDPRKLIAKLEEENQRLREALERIAAYDSYHSEWPTEIWINAPPEELAHVILSGGKYPPQQTHVGGKL